MKKTILKISLTCLIIRVVLFCTTFGAVCAENTTTTTQTLQQVMQNGNVYDLMSYVSRKYASFPDYWGGSPVTGWSYEAYADWLDQKGLSSQLQEDVTITEGASGGRSYNIPQELRETMVQYVNETYIQQNPLGYVETKIYGYDLISPNNFTTYNQYKALQDYIAQSDSPILVYQYSNSNGTWTFTAKTNRNNSLNYVGSVYDTGQFNSVYLYYGWTQNNQNSYTDFKQLNADGSMTNYTSAPVWSRNVYNNNLASTNINNARIISNQKGYENIYVFKNLNALKNYNSGVGQAYYLPTGSTMTVPYYDPFTDNDLQNAGNYYSSIVDNSQSGWTAEQVLSLVDRILGVGGSGGTNNAGTNNDDSFSLGFLGKIGEVISAVTGSITPVSDLVEEGIKNFLEDVFGWLPPEIVALWIAGITFAVFFGILRVIRG